MVGPPGKIGNDGEKGNSGPAGTPGKDGVRGEMVRNPSKFFIVLILLFYHSFIANFNL